MHSVIIGIFHRNPLELVSHLIHAHNIRLYVFHQLYLHTCLLEIHLWFYFVTVQNTMFDFLSHVKLLFGNQLLVVFIQVFIALQRNESNFIRNAQPFENKLTHRNKTHFKISLEHVMIESEEKYNTSEYQPMSQQ